MKIGDLFYNGEKISDIAARCYFADETGCQKCKYYSDQSRICELADYASIEIELPPIIKAADVTADNAIKPKHYKTNKYECIDVMIDVFGVQAVKTFCKLNAFKYIWRTDNNNGVEDIKKAQAYIDKFIELEEVQENDR